MTADECLNQSLRHFSSPLLLFTGRTLAVVARASLSAPGQPLDSPLPGGRREHCRDVLDCLANPYSDSLSRCFFTMPRNVIKCCLLPVAITVATLTDVIVRWKQSPTDDKRPSYPETALSAVLSTVLESSGHNFSGDRATIRFFSQTNN